MKYELSVIVPCYNESLNIHELTERLQYVFNKKNIVGEIILVNDGSTDETGEVIVKLTKKHENLKDIHHKVNKGIAAAWKTGLSVSRGEYVCVIDADLQYLPEDVWRLYREIKKTHVDVVQGYRSNVGRVTNYRYFFTKGLKIMLNILFGINLRDTKSGFVLCKRETFYDIMRYRYKYFYFQTFIAVVAKSKGYTIRELEVLFRERKLGVSYIEKWPIKVIACSLIDITKAFLEFRLFKKEEDILRDFLSHNNIANYKETLQGWRKIFFKLYILLMPFHHWMVSRVAALYYFELKQSQWLSLDKIKELQELKLKKLIHHIYYHVGYYRETFDELGLKPSDIKTIEDLKKLPLLDKNTVRNNLYFDLLSDNHDKRNILKITTSGSTGEPFICYADKHQLEIRWATTLRSMEWTGYRFGDKQARLWHQTIGMTRLQVIREKFDAFLNRRLFIPAFEMNRRNLKDLIDKLRKHEPVLIDGYAESLNFLAHYIKNIGLDGVNPKAIISSAQILPERSRETIEKEFECRVFDKYGSREFSGIAYECEAHDGHHIVAENYIVEILKDGRTAQPGEIGEIVITDLNNFCMPFVRYRIGDLAVEVDNSITCACGRGLPRIGNIEGRVQSIILTTNGTYIPSSFFLHFLKDYDYLIRQFQVIQEKSGIIKLKVVKGLSFAESVFREKVLSALNKYLGDDMIIEVEYVDKIQMIRTGKHQVSMSMMEFDFQNINNKTNGYQ
jgi:phenylacetate-CoA ligase